jgi:RNA polymerase sigma-70 factor (ECF subfamily)
LPRDIEALFREQGTRIYNLLHRLVGHPEEAADLTQDVFLKAQRAFDGFEGRSAESTWLVRIAVNAARDALRRRKVQRRTFRDVMENESGRSPGLEAPAPDRTDRDLEAGESKRIVSEALDELEPGAREILLLREMQGMSYDDIATALGIPLGTVQSRLARSRDALRKAVLRRHPDFHR